MPDAKVIIIKHIIDCDVDPFVPDGLEVEYHHKSGQSLELDINKIQLYLPEVSKKGGFIEGHKLREELANKQVLNANVLDYLLAHLELIPDKWKLEVTISFFGTVYRDASGDLYVPYFKWDRVCEKWVFSRSELNAGWTSTDPVALLITD